MSLILSFTLGFLVTFFGGLLILRYIPRFFDYLTMRSIRSLAKRIEKREHGDDFLRALFNEELIDESMQIAEDVFNSELGRQSLMFTDILKKGKNINHLMCILTLFFLNRNEYNKQGRQLREVDSRIEELISVIKKS